MSTASIPASGSNDSAERCRRAAESHGLTVDMREFPEGTRTAADAAAAVGCEVDQIVKSMIFDADGEIVLALTSGAHQVDPAKLADAAQVGSCGRANPEQVRTVTGYAIGGVSPFGHLQPIRTWLDPHLLTFDEVWVAGGTPRHVFAVSSEQLASTTGAIIADVCVHQ